jgi:hypothetical protein
MEIASVSHTEKRILSQLQPGGPKGRAPDQA